MSLSIVQTLGDLKMAGLKPNPASQVQRIEGFPRPRVLKSHVPADMSGTHSLQRPASGCIHVATAAAIVK